jgi:hypothetical protein
LTIDIAEDIVATLEGRLHAPARQEAKSELSVAMVAKLSRPVGRPLLSA